VDCKVLDEEEKKNLMKRKSALGCHNPFLIRTHPLPRQFIDSGCDADSRACEELVFGEIVFM